MIDSHKGKFSVKKFVASLWQKWMLSSPNGWNESGRS